MPITEFLKNNPNIPHFGIDSHTLWENRHSIQSMKVTLDFLTVRSDEIYKERHICQLINELHELEIFKSLKLYLAIIKSRVIITNDELASLKGLIKLKATDRNTEYPLELKNLESLQELCVRSTSHIIDIEAATTSLQILKRFTAKYANSDAEPKFIDLYRLNRERSKLPNAKKITLYVEEKQYLATKWTIGETDLEFIEQKRIELVDFKDEYLF